MDGEVPLTHYAEVNPKRHLRRGQEYPFVEMAALPEGGGEPSHVGRRVFEGQGSRFAIGDTLFARITPCTENGKTSMVRDLGGRDVGFGSTEFIVLAARDGASPEFVHQIAISPAIRRRAVGRMLGTSGRQRVPTWFFEDELTLPLFSTAEQAVIGETLHAIDEAIEKTEAVIAATEGLRKALLQELLTRGVPGWHTEWKTVAGVGTIPACWEVVRLGEVASGFQYGTSAKCDGAANGIPVLRIPNVARGLLDLADLKYAQLPERELASLRLKGGDLLFVRTNGNPEICGRVALVENLEGDWAYASYLVRLRTGDLLLPAFLWLYLNEENGRRALSRHIRTSAGNFNLSVGGAASIEVPLPSTREQDQIVASVARIRARETCEQLQLDALRDLKALTSDALLSGRVRVAVGEVASG